MSLFIKNYFFLNHESICLIFLRYSFISNNLFRLKKLLFESKKGKLNETVVYEQDLSHCNYEEKLLVA